MTIKGRPTWVTKCTKEAPYVRKITPCKRCGKQYLKLRSNHFFCTLGCRNMYEIEDISSKLTATNNLFKELTADPEFRTLAMALEKGG